MLDELPSKPREPVIVAFGPAKFEDHVSALVIAGLGQTFAEIGEARCEEPRRLGTEVSNNGVGG
ncbi:hypothetical protein GCM10007884_28280 [Methylobacterium brachythecii]|uniref:Uncharacterized protein n=1 Tax=Methylobacterium brachythecii TaxID=1176177 RepID=A0ABQ6D4H8_9HYPH|nr:hypothetical protein GCM10007884_28280 [Methylobacterium brachythecii]